MYRVQTNRHTWRVTIFYNLYISAIVRELILKKKNKTWWLYGSLLCIMYCRFVTCNHIFSYPENTYVIFTWPSCIKVKHWVHQLVKKVSVRQRYFWCQKYNIIKIIQRTSNEWRTLWINKTRRTLMFMKFRRHSSI